MEAGQGPRTITSGDLSSTREGASRTAFLEQGAPPYYGDGYPFAWQDTVNDVRNRVSGVTVPGHGDLMEVAAVATQCEEISAVAAACADALATGLFDATRGPYPSETMQDAWKRAKLERGIEG